MIIEDPDIRYVRFFMSFKDTKADHFNRFRRDKFDQRKQAEETGT